MSNKRIVSDRGEFYPKWADIPGYAGYQASDDGKIVDTRSGKLKRQRPAGNGSLQVHIGKSTRMVHDLVARAHYGRPSCRGYRVKHWNGDRGDNQVDNLLWSGKPRDPSIKEPPRQPPPFAPDVQLAYEGAVSERESLMGLMHRDVAPVRVNNGRP